MIYYGCQAPTMALAEVQRMAHLSHDGLQHARALWSSPLREEEEEESLQGNELESGAFD